MTGEGARVVVVGFLPWSALKCEGRYVVIPSKGQVSHLQQ